MLPLVNLFDWSDSRTFLLSADIVGYFLWLNELNRKLGFGHHPFQRHDQFSVAFFLAQKRIFFLFRWKKKWFFLHLFVVNFVIIILLLLLSLLLLLLFVLYLPPSVRIFSVFSKSILFIYYKNAQQCNTRLSLLFIVLLKTVFARCLSVFLFSFACISYILLLIVVVVVVCVAWFCHISSAFRKCWVCVH